MMVFAMLIYPRFPIQSPAHHYGEALALKYILA